MVRAQVDQILGAVIQRIGDREDVRHLSVVGVAADRAAVVRFAFDIFLYRFWYGWTLPFSERPWRNQVVLVCEEFLVIKKHVTVRQNGFQQSRFVLLRTILREILKELEADTSFIAASIWFNNMRCS